MIFNKLALVVAVTMGSPVAASSGLRNLVASNNFFKNDNKNQAVESEPSGGSDNYVAQVHKCFDAFNGTAASLDAVQCNHLTSLITTVALGQFSLFEHAPEHNEINFISKQVSVNDADHDITNELNTAFELDGLTLKLTDTNELSVDVSSFKNKDLVLDSTSHVLTLTNHKEEDPVTVNLSSLTNQRFELDGLTLELQDADGELSVELSSFKNKDLVLDSTSHVLTLTNEAEVDPVTVNLSSLTNQRFELDGLTLELQDADGELSVELSSFKNKDLVLDSTSHVLTLTNEAEVDPVTVNLSSLNQHISITGIEVSLDNGGGDISLPVQGLTRNDITKEITLTHPSEPDVTVSIADNDNDSTNEIQGLTRDDSNVEITLTHPSEPDVTVSIADNDNDSTNEAQGISIADQTVTLTSVAGAALSGGSFSIADNDNDSTNEAQGILIADQTVTLTSVAGAASSGGSFSIADNDNDSTNEIQTLSFDAGTGALSLSDGGSITIPDYSDSNELISSVVYDSAADTLTITEAGNDFVVDLSPTVRRLRGSDDGLQQIVAEQKAQIAEQKARIDKLEALVQSLL